MKGVKVMLPERKQMILKAIIENYISSAEPVGSKALIGSLDKPLSSATIRNEMSELEEMGLLEKQHVSSGRIPSNLAYRFYVDQLMDRYRMAARELERLRAEMERRMSEMDNALLAASRLVSRLTNQASVALAVGESGEEVRKIELIPMNDTGMQYALVLICSTSVRNKALSLKSPVTPESASTLTGFFNMALSDGRLERLQGVIEQSFGEDSPLSALSKQVLDFVRESSSVRQSTEFYLEGASKLLLNREYQDVKKAGELLDYVGDPKSISELTHGVLPGRINIRIGPENGEPVMNEASFVFTTYDFDRGRKGIIGVIAPTRMDYSRVSAQLAAFVKTLDDIQHKGKGEKNEP